MATSTSFAHAIFRANRETDRLAFIRKFIIRLPFLKHIPSFSSTRIYEVAIIKSKQEAKAIPFAYLNYLIAFTKRANVIN